MHMPRRSPGRRAGRVSRTTFAAAALAAAPLTVTTAAHAQSLTDSSVTTGAALVPRGPTLDGARAGAIRATTATDSAPTAAPVSGPRAGRPVALMVVGGTALILGAIIGGAGGTAVAVGGAVVGLVGLYQFIR